jgi:hypothetical protein
LSSRAQRSEGEGPAVFFLAHDSRREVIFDRASLSGN